MTTIYYPRWVPFADALALSPSIVLITDKYRSNTPLRVHELVHVEQLKRDGTLTFWWRYLTNRTHRLNYEVEAYKAQIAAGASQITCAMHLATDYRLGITQAQAMQLLE